MKVICRDCRELINESEAIKMTIAEYSTFVQIKEKIEFISVPPQDHHIYTQICQECYKKK